jgi:hypothetical protein
MKIGPRAQFILIASVFLLPILASLAAYRFFRPEPSANYGELLSPPPTITSHPFGRDGGGRFGFAELRDRWVMVASDSGECAAPCVEKMVAMRQVRLALGRNASRVARVFVVDDLRAPAAPARFEGMVVAITPKGMQLPPGAANDRAYIYLVDPRGNVILRWPARPDMRRMYKDLERLLKASQIG